VIEQLREGPASTIEVACRTLAGVGTAGALGVGTDPLATDQLHRAQAGPLRIHGTNGVQGEGPSGAPRREVDQSLRIDTRQATQGGIDHPQRLADAGRCLSQEYLTARERPPDRPRERPLAGAEVARREGQVPEQRVAAFEPDPLGPEPARIGAAGLVEEGAEPVRRRGHGVAFAGLRVRLQVHQLELQRSLVLDRPLGEPERSVEPQLGVVGTPFPLAHDLDGPPVRLQLLDAYPPVALEDAVRAAADVERHPFPAPVAGEPDFRSIALALALLVALRALQPLQRRHRRGRTGADVAAPVHEVRQMPHGDPEARRGRAHRQRTSMTSARAPRRTRSSSQRPCASRS
jgi:hypothetical protein